MTRALAFTILLSAAPAAQTAQKPEVMGVEEATLLTQGWAYLAQGDLAKADGVLQTIRSGGQASLAGLALGVEIDVARRGAHAALDGYEAWRGSRSFEEPLALRRIARARLFELARTAGAPAARMAALSALANENEAWAQTEILNAARQGSVADIVTLAARGNDAAVQRVGEALKTPVGNKMALIDALGQSRSRQAIVPLEGLLKDPRPEHQAAAIRALAQLGATQVLPQARAVLGSTTAPPDLRLAAAAALLQLNDASGVSVLTSALASPVAGIQLAAAEGLARRPDAAWTSTVRQLTQHSDPVIRIGAARLIAPIDPAMARAALDQLINDPNLAVREEAGRVLAASVAQDFATLRHLLRSPTVDVQASAATRILEMTR